MLAILVRHWRTHLSAAVVGAMAAFLIGAGHGPRVIVGGQLPTIMAVRAGQSNNWAGYALGALDRQVSPFNAISAEWIVPAARPRAEHQAGFSATWVGIGGGCIDRTCSLTDGTLVQAGTEQDVDPQGVAGYSAWYELVPGPMVHLAAVQVRPGDRIRVDVHEVSPGAESWSISVADLTSRTAATATAQYPSSSLSAEWVEESPLIEDSSGALSVGELPELSRVTFEHASLNGAPARLGDGRVELVDLVGSVLAVPSAPGPSGDSFSVCAGRARACPAPGAR